MVPLGQPDFIQLIIANKKRDNMITRTIHKSIITSNLLITLAYIACLGDLPTTD